MIRMSYLLFFSYGCIKTTCNITGPIRVRVELNINYVFSFIHRLRSFQYRKVWAVTRHLFLCDLSTNISFLLTMHHSQWFWLHLWVSQLRCPWQLFWKQHPYLTWLSQRQHVSHSTMAYPRYRWKIGNHWNWDPHWPWIMSQDRHGQCQNFHRQIVHRRYCFPPVPFPFVMSPPFKDCLHIYFNVFQKQAINIEGES